MSANLMQWIDRLSYTQSDILHEGREAVLNRVTLIAAIFGSIGLASLILLQIVGITDLELTPLIYVTFILVVSTVWALALSRNVPFSQRAQIFLIMIYLASIQLSFTSALIGNSRLILAFLPVLATTLLGIRIGLGTLLLSILTVGVTGWSQSVGQIPIISPEALEQIAAGRTVVNYLINFTVIASLTVYILYQINESIEKSIIGEQTLLNELREEGRQLERRVASRARSLQTSTAISQRLSTILRQDELIEVVLNELQQRLQYDYVQVYLVERGRQETNNGPVLNLSRGVNPAGGIYQPSDTTVPFGVGFIGRAAATGQVIWATDTRSHPDWVYSQYLPNTQAEIAVPILIEGQVWGVLDIQQNESTALNQDDVSLLEIVARQLGIGLRNAQTYTLAQRQARHEELLNAVSGQIQEAASIHEVFKVAGEQLSQEVSAKKLDLSIRPQPRRLN